MADITIGYKGATIAEISASGTTTLETAGKYCEDDITLQYVRPSAPTQNDDSIYLLRALPYTSYLKQLKKIIGGTVAWNQLVNKASIPVTKTDNDITFTNNGDGSITVSGTASATTRFTIVSAKDYLAHKYLLTGCPASGSSATYMLELYGQGSPVVDAGSGKIWDGTAPYKGIVIEVKNGTAISTPVVFKPQFFDLTAMFGSTIADYVYTLESGTAGAGIAWLKKYGYFTKPYYPYKAAALESVKTSAHKTIGFNQWDEEWESGYINATDGTNVASTHYIRSTNFIRIVPNTTYYIKTPAVLKLIGYDANKNFVKAIDYTWGNEIIAESYFDGITYIRFYNAGSDSITTYNHDICINISDASLNGTYQPYCVGNYALDSTIELRGLLKLDANNNLYYDGDEYTPNGNIKRNYGTRAYQSGDESDSSVLTDGTNTIYKLSTPTTESATPYIEHQACFPNGTEEFVDGRTVEMPVEAVAEYEVTS